MNSIFIKVGTAWRLGACNIVRVLLYRLGVRFGVVTNSASHRVTPRGVFFSAPEKKSPSLSTVEVSNQAFKAFGLESQLLQEDNIPDWNQNILTGASLECLPWWQLPDFTDEIGDIKGIWEASRFSWALALAQQAVAGQPEALDRLNLWVSDWCEKNPPYIGANWKCGQEASIRVMHLAMCARILGQEHASNSALMELIHVHLRRIAPTIQYAMAQDNNHGVSEAAALFIGGSWLARAAQDASGLHREARSWAKQGRKWLENRARRLIEVDGSFSQYSINYHRLMLDVYSMAELWRKSFEMPAFSDELVERLKSATAWLGNMVCPSGSDTPNMGANDGAQLLPLSGSDYRDVRPTVQLASVLFAGQRAYSELGAWNESLQWLRVCIPDGSTKYLCSRRYNDGGYVVIRSKPAAVFLRYPRFRFRPSQSDLFHVDFWVGGVNVFRDAGTYSYNCEEPWQSYFSSSEAHNTVQFDGRDAMPRLSRFLYGAWPKAIKVSEIVEKDGHQCFSAGYRDWKGACHHRSVCLSEGALRVVDDVDNFDSSAVLRWRLPAGVWKWKDGFLVGQHLQIQIKASQPIKRCELVEGWESRYYSRKMSLIVLEVEVEQAGTLTTELKF